MTPAPPSPLVYVIVLNYNSAEHLTYSLPSICATEYANLEMVVVDNASTDRSLEVAANFPVRTLKSDRNVGWSGGNNLGVLQALRAGAQYVVLANSDILVHPRWIAEAVAIADSNPDIGVIGFDVHEPHPQDDDRDAGYSVSSRRWTAPAITGSPEYVGGMAMFVRGSLFEELGLIDENFFAYGEENDFQIRAKRAGYRVMSINVPVWHYGEASFRKTPFRASLLQTENNIQLLLKHRGIVDVLRAGVDHIYHRCASARKAPPATAVERRLRGGSTFQALGILLLAAIRVVFKSPAILWRRVEDRRLIAAARARRGLPQINSRQNGASH